MRAKQLGQEGINQHPTTCSEDTQKQIVPNATFEDGSDILHLLWLCFYAVLVPQGAASEIEELWQPTRSPESRTRHFATLRRARCSDRNPKCLVPGLESRCGVFGAKAAANTHPWWAILCINSCINSSAVKVTRRLLCLQILMRISLNYFFLTSCLPNKSQFQCGTSSKNCSLQVINAFKKCGRVISAKDGLRFRLQLLGAIQVTNDTYSP